MCTNIKWISGEGFSRRNLANWRDLCVPNCCSSGITSTGPAAAVSTTRDQDRNWTATPIFGRHRQICDRSFSIRQGAAEVKPDNKMEIYNKGQGEVKYSVSADFATDATASADTASADITTADTAMRPGCWWRNEMMLARTETLRARNGSLCPWYACSDKK